MTNTRTTCEDEKKDMGRTSVTQPYSKKTTPHCMHNQSVTVWSHRAMIKVVTTHLKIESV
jgi:hypothetical protein